MKTILSVCLLALISANASAETSTAAAEKKIGVLLVNHGSRSATWRQALLDLEQSVRPSLLTNKGVQGIKTAFMEYTEPSIATRMKEFDAEGFSDVVIVPVFLTVSSHTFDDIPTIIGKKTDPHSLETLKIEKIERYKPKANTIITPNLDFTGVLKKNVLRRAKSLSTNPAEEGLVMIAYGDATYEREWGALLNTVGEHVKQNTGIGTHSYGWCGHVAHYDPKKTTDAIDKVLQTRKRAVVIPVLVAHDEMFQIKIIGDGIAKVADNKARVIYRPDSILPDAGVEQWVIDITGEFVARLNPALAPEFRRPTASPQARAGQPRLASQQ
jgi:hypothetical protein